MMAVGTIYKFVIMRSIRPDSMLTIEKYNRLVSECNESCTSNPQLKLCSDILKFRLRLASTGSNLIRVNVECCQPVELSRIGCLHYMGSNPLAPFPMASLTASLIDNLLVWRPWQVNVFDPRQSR